MYVRILGPIYVQYIANNFFRASYNRSKRVSRLARSRCFLNKRYFLNLLTVSGIRLACFFCCKSFLFQYPAFTEGKTIAKHPCGNDIGTLYRSPLKEENKPLLSQQATIKQYYPS